MDVWQQNLKPPMSRGSLTAPHDKVFSTVCDVRIQKPVAAWKERKNDTVCRNALYMQIWGKQWPLTRNFDKKRVHQKVRVDKEREWESESILLPLSLSLCFSLNNVISMQGYVGQWGFASPGDQSHTPTHTHLLNSLTGPWLVRLSASLVNSLRDVIHFS